MSRMIDCSSVRIVRVHKEQFDAINTKADTVIITCIEDGRSVSFDRSDSKVDKIEDVKS